VANLSPTPRPHTARRPAWQRRTAGLCAAGAGVAFIGLLVSPRAHADADGASLYGDLSTIYGDVSAFENSYGLFQDTVFFSDLASPGDIVAASGFDLGDPFPAGATASEDLSAVAAEGDTLTSQLADLQATAAADGNELAVINDALSLQQQINSAVGDLATITGQDETNPLLIADLSAIYSNEVNYDTFLVNLGDALAIDSPAGITADNAYILSEGLGMVNDLQSSADTLTILADLASSGL